MIQTGKQRRRSTVSGALRWRLKSLCCAVSVVEDANLLEKSHRRFVVLSDDCNLLKYTHVSTNTTDPWPLHVHVEWAASPHAVCHQRTSLWSTYTALTLLSVLCTKDPFEVDAPTTPPG